jgi:hypothetical protein
MGPQVVRVTALALATCRLHLWKHWLEAAATPEEGARRWQWLLNYLATAT